MRTTLALSRAPRQRRRYHHPAHQFMPAASA